MVDTSVQLKALKSIEFMSTMFMDFKVSSLCNKAVQVVWVAVNLCSLAVTVVNAIGWVKISYTFASVIYFFWGEA